ncbi:hypothetical protein INR49_019522 [Caranx melampygus]|nr:hypothetical protein INR49_019522 [Caranx melampygus]
MQQIALATERSSFAGLTRNKQNARRPTLGHALDFTGSVMDPSAAERQSIWISGEFSALSCPRSLADVICAAVWTVPLTGGTGHFVVRCKQTEPMRLRRTEEHRSRRGTVSAHIEGQNEVSLSDEL